MRFCAVIAFCVAMLAPSIGAEERKVAWTSSKIRGRPEPGPAFRTRRVFANVKFVNPLVMAVPQGEKRFYVGEQSGKIFSFAQREDAKAELAIDLAKEIRTFQQTLHGKDLEALYGLVFHPRFPENRFCYICYTIRDERPGKQLENGTRVSRFTVTKADPPRIDPSTESIVLTFLQGGHNGGDLHFGPDGMLYISTGDGAGPNPPDPLKTGQDCSDLLSSILRIDVDHPSPGKAYSIPKDNPFTATRNTRPEIWAFGFRNPWRMSFDAATGDLWVGDVGWELWEMIHRVRRGGNYGWSIVEGRQSVMPDQPMGPAPILPPTIPLPHAISASVTGGRVYRGKQFPELVGKYIFGDWETRRIWAASFDSDRVHDFREIVDPTLRIVAFGTDDAGELYILDYDAGTLHTLERNPPSQANAAFPKLLSETGLYVSLSPQKSAPGVEEFSINAPQWMDGAKAKYLIGLPGTSHVQWHERDVPIANSMFGRQLVFPTDGVLTKSIAIETHPGDPNSNRLLETQVLHYDGRQWQGYSYVWRADQKDAELAPAEGKEIRFEVVDPSVPGRKRLQSWPIFSRTQCFLCHNPWAQTTLAFNIGQLNDSQVQGVSPQLAKLQNQGLLQYYDAAGKLAKAPSATMLSSLPKIARTADDKLPVDLRARSYLHANCGHCHRMGGGGSVDLELHNAIELKNSKTLDVRPAQGGFGLSDPRIIAPGDPFRSVMFYRMLKTGAGRMPHLGSQVVDQQGIALIGDWIRGLDAKAATAMPESSQLDSKRLATLKSAMKAAIEIGSCRMPVGERERVLADASKHPEPAIRDLFEGFQPPERRMPRVGSSPDSAAILAQKGDAIRGHTLFWNQSTLQCRNCHQVNGEGVKLGPDLTRIARQRSKAELLDSLLNPSAKIETAFQQFTILSTDGSTYTGLIVRRSQAEIVLKDAKNKETRLPMSEVHKIQASAVSLMPEGLIRDVTIQEAADVLEYLSTLK